MQKVLTGLTLCVALMGGAVAQPVSFNGQNETVLVSHVATSRARVGESDLDFLLRKAVFFRDFTRISGFELCSQICRSSDGRLGLVAVTSRSHIGCAVVNQCPSGMIETGETIHSHPIASTYKTNQADRAFLSARRPVRAIKRNERRSLEEKSVFSSTDFAGGPGYLVVSDALLYQNGPGSEVKVGLVPPAH